MTERTPQVLAHRRGALGHLTLNRPQAINALNLEMIQLIGATLDQWRGDPELTVVLLDGAGERGLCAGGDVRAAHDAIVAGHPEIACAYFRAEYHVDAALAEFPRPVIALMDGVTMGGGIGLAAHATIRIVTERSVVAMPEARIGFTPDVGGSLLLARAPGRLGEYLAAGAVTMGPGDAIAAGFADLFVPSERLGELRTALETAGDDPASVVRRFAVDPPASDLHHERIDEWYSAPTAAELLARLDRAAASGDDRATTDAQAIRAMSPTSVSIALASVRAARELPGADAATTGPALRAALAQEYGLVCWFSTRCPDMPEGIRAQLVDKDRLPRWQPATIAEVSEQIIAEAFAFVPEIALWEDLS